MSSTIQSADEATGTLERHLATHKPRHTSEGGDLAGVLRAIAEAGKAIARMVRRARLDDVLGDVGTENVHGEKQQKLDVLSNDVLTQRLREHPDVAVISSEELDEPLVIRTRSQGGVYSVAFDPLDGSSNVDVAVSVGTIFSVLPNRETDGRTARAPLQPGSRQSAAGYILYGSSVLMALTMGDGVALFVLDLDRDEFVLVERSLKITRRHKIYSINEGYWNDFPRGYQRYLGWAHDNGYASRYIGSMVADVHRTLLLGGVFLYPPTRKDPEGKLRLLYEASPMAMLVEQAGGSAAAGEKRILDIAPSSLHQRTAVVMGSVDEVQHVVEQLTR